MESFASGFARVDNTTDANSFIQYLDLIHSLSFFQECKNHSYEKLKLSTGDSVLEIGCGKGIDAKKLSEIVGEFGSAVGIDISSTMLCAARETAQTSPYHPEFLLCDGQQLAFHDATFHAVRADRVIQHTSNPFAVIREIARVTRSAGTVVVFEPDWGTFALWPGDRDMSRKILNFWCDSIPSGWVGRSLFAAFSKAGLVEIEVQPLTLTLTDLAITKKIYDLDTTFSHAVQKGIASLEEVESWVEDLTLADSRGQLFSSLTFFQVTGKKP